LEQVFVTAHVDGVKHDSYVVFCGLCKIGDLQYDIVCRVKIKIRDRGGDEDSLTSLIGI
jgi:hypothetical protein